ncbi:MAG TPA: HTTM domain-containing protein [Kofleriaceae bacterium]|nr:HTTM domain-containing protein [Kofleriaceae bacterium]
MAKRRNKGGNKRQSDKRDTRDRGNDKRESDKRASDSDGGIDKRDSDKRASDTRDGGNDKRESDKRPSDTRDGGNDKPSRGKQRREAVRLERAAGAQTSELSSSEPVAEPAFWFGFDISWAKLVLGRFVFFALLAIDSLLNFAHAPRYGAGDFNVAQLPIFDVLAPTRVSYAIGSLLCAWLFALAACGAATRIVLPIATVVYGWLYFGSHLDSYQHHYLVWLIVLLSCFVPWQKPADAVPATRVRSWALRLVLVQLGILYLWAAISKLSPAWFDGRTLGSQIHGGMRSFIDATIGIKGASAMVVFVELALAGTVWNKRTWWLAAPLGLALHLGIVKTNLEIGLFAWLMVGLYIFIIPDRVWLWLASRRPVAATYRFVGAVRESFGGALAWIVLMMSVGLGFVLAFVSRFDYSAVVGLSLVGGVIVLAIFERRHVGRLAAAHLVALTLWVVVDRSSSSAADYYRFWGGSSRRLGDTKTSEYAYRKMTRVAPDDGGGHFQLGKLLLARDANDEGLAELRLAQQLEPLKSRAYTAEAKWLATHGKKDDAIVKAREATIIDPTDADARSLLDSLGGQ